MVDENAIAGLLHQVFAVEMTTAIGTCGECGAAEPGRGGSRFRGTGVVMRLPALRQRPCNDPQGRHTRRIGFVGVRTLQVTV